MIQLYILNVLIIALPLALVEIWLEKFKTGPWGDTEFMHPFWGKKIHTRWLCRLMQKKHVTPYHLFIFAFLLTSIMTCEWLLVGGVSGHGFWVINPSWPLLGSIKIIPLIFFPAVWIGVAVFEDALWFILNWRAPDSLARLMRKEFPWHTQYWPVNRSRTKWLPKFYIQMPAYLVVMFVAQTVIIHIVG